MKTIQTNNGKKGGSLVGKSHAEGGIKAVVVDTQRPIEVESGEVIINKHAAKKYWKELSEINQSAGNGVPIEEPIFAKGGNFESTDKKEIYKKWKQLVNMSHSELKDFYESKEGKEAGLSKNEAREQGIHSGRESAEWIMKMKKTPMSEWTLPMWRWAKRQISFINRMSGVNGDLYDDKGNKTRKHTSLLIWGHNPKKMKMGGGIEFITEKKGTLIRGNEIIKYAEKVNGNYRLVFYKIKESNGRVPIVCDAFDYCHKLDTNDVSADELIELIKKNNLMEEGGNVITYRNKFNKKYGFELNESHSLKEIAKLTDIKLSSLQDIYDKGIGAYKTNPASVRPNVKSKEQWAMARVYSAIMGGKAARVDSNELERGNKYSEGGLIPANGSLVTKDKKLKLDYNKIGNDFEFVVYEGEPNSVEGYTKVSYKKRDKNKVLMNYNQFVNYLYSEGFIDYKFGKGGFIAPNGKPSNLTPEQYKLVRTPEFKAWFGDWENDPKNASKVIDENGEPLVVYRGFNSKSDVGFKFKYGINRFKNNRNSNRFAHYFTRSKNVANEYAEQGEKKNEKDVIVKSYFLKSNSLLDLTKNNKSYPSFDEWVKVRESYMEFSLYGLIKQLENRLIPTYSYLFSSVIDKAKDENDIDELSELKIKEVNNKIKLEEKDNLKRYNDSEDINLFQLVKMISGKELDKVLNDSYNINDAEVKRNVFEWFINYKASDSIVISSLDIFLKELIINSGYNGGVFNEFQFGVRKPIDKEVYFVFDSNQIKLADGTNTTFDGGNPDIRYEQGGGIEVDCIEFIKNTEAIKNNGYYLHIKNTNVYVGADDKKISNVKSLLLITYNSGGQSNLKASDTINSSLLSTELAKLLGCEISVARIIVSEQISHSKRFSLDILNNFKNENIIIADRGKIECTNIGKFEQGGVIAPNGKPSNLTPEQYKLVRTPEFKAWFGDWENDPANASKVVDMNGEPLAVYHGTKESFNEFKKEKQNAATGFGDFGAGFYFTSSYGTAKYYTIKFENRIIFSVFLKILNPFVIELNWERFSENTIENYKKLKGLFDWQKLAIKNVLIDKNDYRPSKTITKEIGDFNFQDILIVNGFDGVFVNRFNIFEFEDANHQNQILPLNEIVAFEPNQIKLADGSNTTFDSNNLDIRYEQGGGVEVDDLGEIFVIKNKLKSGVELLEAYMVVDKTNPFVLQFKNRAIYCLKFSKNKDGKWHFYNVAVGFTKEEFKEIKEKSLKPTLQNTSIIIGAEKKILYELMKYEIDYLISKSFVLSPLFVDKYGVTYSVDKIDDDFYSVNESFVKKGKSVENNNSLDTYANLGGNVFKAINNLYKRAKEEKEMAKGGDVGQKIKCRRCGWHWNTKDSEEFDKYVCHKCGYDNELKKGIKAESEHIKTAKDLYEHNITPNQAAKSIAEEHLSEDPEYYTKLLEKFENGGGIDETFSFKTPTGEPSRLTYLQQVLVRTKAFKNWFGDWETAAKNFLKDNKQNFNIHYKGISKVIDGITREPKVVYHGTRTADEFYMFDVSKEKGVGRPYAYFAHNQEYSENFTTFSQRGDNNSKPLMYNCFLCIKNPFMAKGHEYSDKKRDAKSWIRTIVGTIVWDKYETIERNEKTKKFENVVKEQIEKYLNEAIGNDKRPFWAFMARDKNSEFKMFLVSHGYDGIFYTEEFSSLYDVENPKEFTEAVTVFNPNDIKLADGRNLNFNPMQSDIRYETGGNLEEPIKEEPILSKKDRLGKLLFGEKYANGGGINKENNIIQKTNETSENRKFVDNLIKKINE